MNCLGMDRRTLHWPSILAGLLIVSCSLTTLASAQVLSNNPSAVSDEVNLALSVSAQNKYDEAIALLGSDPTKARTLFAESAQEFQKVVESGISNGDLYFNLGNALVQCDDIGSAIGAYLQAERLLPGDSRIATNLAHARTLVSDHAAASTQLAPLDRASSLWRWFSYPARVWSAWIAWTMIWIIVAAGILSGWTTRVRWRPLIVAASIGCLTVAGTIGIDTIRRELNPPGVLVRDLVVVRKGNGEGFAPAFTEPLSRGAEFTMLEVRPGWYRIRLSDGQSGWIRTSDAIVAGEKSANKSPA